MTSDFSAFNKTTSQSFNHQKGLIKRALSGKLSQCPECKKNLNIILPEHNNSKNNAQKAPGIYCVKGCTDIELEMEAVKK
ncbi:MAG: hypothetical protein ACPGUD_07325 [Parashewanella sp.]